MTLAFIQQTTWPSNEGLAVHGVLGHEKVDQQRESTKGKSTICKLFKDSEQPEAAGREDPYLDYDWPTVYAESFLWEHAAKGTTPQTTCKVDCVRHEETSKELFIIMERSFTALEMLCLD